MKNAKSWYSSALSSAAGFGLWSKVSLAACCVCLLGLAHNANAGDIPQSDPTAPCGILTKVGGDRYIYNNSNYHFNVRFVTQSLRLYFNKRVNAAAIKYLVFDQEGKGIWKDSGTGSMGEQKTYVIPSPPNTDTLANGAVRIAYCSDTSNGWPNVSGQVYFEPDASEGAHNSPAGHVQFRSQGYDQVHPVYRTDQLIVHFDLPNSVTTPYVFYNENALGGREDGSLVICPTDRGCLR